MSVQLDNAINEACDELRRCGRHIERIADAMAMTLGETPAVLTLTELSKHLLEQSGKLSTAWTSYIHGEFHKGRELFGELLKKVSDLSA